MTTFIHKLHQEEALAALASAEDHGWLPTVEIDTDFLHTFSNRSRSMLRKWQPKWRYWRSKGGDGDHGKSWKEEWSTVSFMQGISSSRCRKVDLLMSEKWPVPCLFLDGTIKGAELSSSRFHPLSPQTLAGLRCTLQRTYGGWLWENMAMGV